MARKSKRLLRKSRIRNTRSKRKLTKRRIRPRKKIKTRKRRRKKRKLAGGAAGDPNSIVEQNNAIVTQAAAGAQQQPSVLPLAAAEAQQQPVPLLLQATTAGIHDLEPLPEDPEEEFVPPGPHLFAQPGSSFGPPPPPLSPDSLQSLQQTSSFGPFMNTSSDVEQNNAVLKAFQNQDQVG